MADLITAEQRAAVAAGRLSARIRMAKGARVDLVRVSDLQDVLSALTTAEADLKAALKEVVAYAAEAGFAKGKLEASEAAGVVDGWRERAEKAEAERDALTAEVERLETDVKYLGVGDFIHQEEIAELIEDGAVTWLPISEAVPVERQSIIVCTADEPPIVGEAVWLSEDGKPLDLWWANTSPGDYYFDPISQSNARVVAFRPMPEAPCAARLQSLASPTQAERAEP